MLSTMASYMANLENLMKEGITAGQPCKKYYVYSKPSLSVVLFLSLLTYHTSLCFL
jgi:hypothetical protein